MRILDRLCRYVTPTSLRANLASTGVPTDNHRRVQDQPPRHEIHRIIADGHGDLLKPGSVAGKQILE